MASTEFLRTEQKNEKIMHTNFDLSHKNMNTYNLGEIKVSQYEPILPSDSVELKVNDEVICQALENPAFSHFKLCHKTVYMPNCNLWKYWDRFITEKPDFTWTSSAIQQFIENEQPYTPPYFTWYDILPIVSLARGFVKTFNICICPIQDRSTSPYVTYNGNNFYDILNHGNSFYSANSYSPSPEVLYIGRAFDPSTLLDETASYSAGTNETNLEWLFYSFVTNNSLLWSDSTPVTSSDINKFRFWISFVPTDRQYLSIDVQEKRVVHDYNSFVDFSVLHFTLVDYQSSGYSPIDLTTLLPSRILVRVRNLSSASQPSSQFILPLPAGYEAAQYNMSVLSYLWYLCNNAVKLLDSFNIPVYVDKLMVSDYKFDALPFFAYSRIYHEIFANKQIQVNAPDWSEANGPLCPSYSSEDSPNNHYTYGWILHHPELPYNVNTFTYDEKIIIRNYWQAQCLLLGLNINSLMFSSNLDLTSDPFDRSNKSLSHTYMVYNGLLHLQYQNFPPDYFTEALLDPLAGAKDINIPSTITQLQEKSKLQDFLNQTAWTRNIKEWLQSQWDSFSKFTTINEPSLCGSSDVDINISQILQTSESANTPLGTRAGVGSGYGNGYLCKQQFGEYGVLLTVSYIVLDTMYINRLDIRQRHKSSRFDYPLPQFANLGNEAILPTELNVEPSVQVTFGSSVYGSYISDTSQVIGFKTTQSPRDIMDSYSQSGGQYLPDNATPNIAEPSVVNRVFGYIPRYSIYKHHMDEVHGNFLTTLKRWVPSRELGTRPTYLSYAFISYELAAKTCNLLKNFVNTTSFSDDNFLVNHTNILYIRRALPYIVKPQL